MASKKPLAVYDSVVREIDPGDLLDANDVAFTPNEFLTSTTVQGAIEELQADRIGLFEVEVDGGLMPVTDLYPDHNYDLDENDDIQPKDI